MGSSNYKFVPSYIQNQNDRKEDGSDKAMVTKGALTSTCMKEMQELVVVDDLFKE